LSPIRGGDSGGEENFFSREKKLFPIPQPHPFSRKARYFEGKYIFTFRELLSSSCFFYFNRKDTLTGKPVIHIVAIR